MRASFRKFRSLLERYVRKLKLPEHSVLTRPKRLHANLIRNLIHFICFDIKIELIARRCLNDVHLCPDLELKRGRVL